MVDVLVIEWHAGVKLLCFMPALCVRCQPTPTGLLQSQFGGGSGAAKPPPRKILFGIFEAKPRKNQTIWDAGPIPSGFASALPAPPSILTIFDRYARLAMIRRNRN